MEANKPQMQPIESVLSQKFAALPAHEQVNGELAELLGWTGIEYDCDVENSLVGYPPEAEGHKEIVPDWAGNFQEAMSLILSHNVSLDLSEETGVTAIIGYRNKGYTAKRERYEGYGTKGEAVAMAIAMALTAHLVVQKRAATAGVKA